MPLSRELCERLAAAYPDVWTARRKDADDSELTWGSQGKFVWCPRLDQLLELAVSLVPDAEHAILHSERSDTGQRSWSYLVRRPDRGNPVSRHGDTPEEAVANWLLTLANGGITRRGL